VSGPVLFELHFRQVERTYLVGKEAFKINLLSPRLGLAQTLGFPYTANRPYMSRVGPNRTLEFHILHIRRI
jgi:hypothetical protein